MIPELDKKDVDIDNIAEKALQDKEVLSELLEGILSNTDTRRYNSFQVLSLLSERHTEVLYSYWEYFESLLGSKNNYIKYIALHLIADLTKVDTGNKFERVFNTYYSILDGDKTMTAAHVAAVSGKIAKYKPTLQTRITEKLLNIDRTHRGSQKELIKGHAVEAFHEYFEEAENRDEILAFVREQLKSTSPRTRKVAGEFLKKWGKP